MNSAKHENIFAFECLHIDHISPEEVKVYPNGNTLYFNSQTPFTAQKVFLYDGERLDNVIKLRLDERNYYYIWEDDFLKTVFI